MRRPGCDFRPVKRQIRAGLSLIKDCSRLQTDSRVKHAVRYISRQITAAVREYNCFRHFTDIGKKDDSELTAHYDKTLVFFRIQVTMRPDI